jgi:hypothetical protein
MMRGFWRRSASKEAQAFFFAIRPSFFFGGNEMKISKAVRNLGAALLLSVASMPVSAATAELFRHDFTTTDTIFNLGFLPTFKIEHSGLVTATLNNVGFPSDFSFLGMAVVKSGGATYGKIFTPGSFDFTVGPSDFGDFRVLLAYQGTLPGSAGTLNVVGPIPEPEIWALMLVGGGLVGFQLRRKRKAMEANRLALA